MWSPRGWEWIIILLIVLLLFGPGRVGKVAGEIGKGIRAFRDGLSGANEEQQAPDEDDTAK